ncbi:MULTISPECIES: Bax inhibitor-1/YccA family protein [Clostridium]|uniref:Bax inhibitor-1/YccA family protein n=1 Tax=Clostridium frigoriphilum TaxID=443253 RepID=A0ABU7UWB6_9CLOT|nr:Bax inhibitor-1/YccA family protein [Clostridium sp. DSM 17811]MBU3101891.1 Bax inhibitor-1/YccA family protein [Clostridium sp. DSM 17811]
MESNSLIKSRSTFIGKTLCLMAVGLLITFIVGLFTSNYIMNVSTTVIYGAMILELVMVITLVKRVAKMSTTSGIFWFLVYSALNGVTLSIVFLTVNQGQLITVFALTSLMFLSSGMVGITTKKDLSAIGQFAMMFVIGLILLTIMQMFFVSSTFDLGVCLLGIIVFGALTAYDMQKIKHMQAQSNDMHGVVLAALTLYLDFINIFLFVLRLFSRR